MKEIRPKIVSIIGTNASGKSNLAVYLAKTFAGEVISADSRQVYLGLNLGTGKLTAAEMDRVPHHLIDIVKPNEPFSVADFQHFAYAAIDDILSRNKLPFLAGGTGLYTRAVTRGYQLSSVKPNYALRQQLEAMSQEELIAELMNLDPAKAAIVDQNNKRRLVRAVERCRGGETAFDGERCTPRYEVLQLGVTWPRPILYERIEARLQLRIQQGMIQEVEELLNQGVSRQFLEDLGLEYRYIYRYISGGFTSYEEFYQALFQAIRQFAKRQMVWFKKEETTIWLDMASDYRGEAEALVRKFIRLHG